METEIYHAYRKIISFRETKATDPISCLVNSSKIMDRIMAEYILADMSISRDTQQYVNEKGLSLNHLLIKKLNKILTAMDRNSQDKKYAVILTMLDWSRAFENQSHFHGDQLFIDNGAHAPLIPVLISFFQERDIVVKWKGVFGSPKGVAGQAPGWQLQLCARIPLQDLP